MVDLRVAEERLRQGLFKAATEALGTAAPASLHDPWHIALMAEACERTGRMAEAMAAVREVSRRERKGRALSRALIVAGVTVLAAAAA